ncbi:MAG: hypothetical protein HGGPFJEG_02452 [Ignavibacteria bacterium]|nr:hypothetical protein [Ignavibacteria bacterium]
MKKILLTFALLFILAFQNSFAQFGNSRAILTGVSQGRNVNINTTPCSHTVSGFGGVILCTLDGVANTPFFCLDLCTDIAVGDTSKDSASTISQAIYITNNYFPGKTSYPGIMSDVNDEACAVQLAIWHFRNGLNSDMITGIGGSNDAAILARMNAIIADVNLNGGSSTHISTVKIKPGVDPSDFYIETKDTAGNPISVSNIQLSITGAGVLSTYTVNTNASGVSPDVTVSGSVLPGDVISASANVQIPAGISYSGLTQILQLLVLGRTTTGIRTDQITWGALPVELSAFTANVNYRNVDLYWKTTSEVNNSGFEIERLTVGTETWSKVGQVQGNGNTTVAREYYFSDRNLETGTYNYRLKQIDFNGNFEYHYLNTDVIIGTPVQFSLSQNYPNPFNPETKINFQIPVDGFVTLKVFDNSGKTIAVLVNDNLPAGYHTADFNASSLSSGVYFYKLEAAGFTKVMKMALVK